MEKKKNGYVNIHFFISDVILRRYIPLLQIWVLLYYLDSNTFQYYDVSFNFLIKPNKGTNCTSFQ